MSQTKKLLVQALILIVLVWIAYWNSLHNPFAFDDWHVIPSNPSIKSPGNIPSFFEDVSHFSLLVGNRGYRPLFLTSMTLSWWIGGGKTWPFHLMSVSLHMMNVLLLFFILRLFFTGQRDSIERSPTLQSRWVPFLASALFALHPLATESLNYISSQSVPLTAFFFLLGFYCFLKVYHSGWGWSRKTKGLVLAGSYLSYFLALLSKPIGIQLPLVLLFWDFIFGKSEISPESPPWKHYGKRILKHLPYWGISLIYVYIRQLVSPSPFGKGGSGRYVWYLTQTKAMVTYYLKLAVLPSGLNVDREFPRVFSLLDWQVLGSISVLLGIAFLLFRFRNQKFLVFWALWFPACLMVTTYVMVLGQVVNEHRVYLSLAGFCAVWSYLLVRLFQAFPLQYAGRTIGAQWGRPGTLALVLLILLSLGYGTIERNKVWSSDLTLWENAAFNEGTWRAHMNYGLALEGKGRKDEALAQLQEGVKLGPYSFAHLNLGLALVKRGKQAEGIEHLRKAVRLWRTSPEAHLFLGWGLKRGGNLVEAEQEYRKALALRPNYVKAYRFLAELYEAQGREEDAVATLAKMRAIDPTTTSTDQRVGQLANRLFNEAFALQKGGQRQQAIDRYKKLLRVQSSHRQGTFNLAFAYLNGTTNNDWYQSAKMFQKVLEIDPTYTEALYRIASAYWKLQIEEEAIRYDRLYLQKGNHRDLRAISRKRLEEAEKRKSGKE